jgi:membrane-associated phospholipid phosphatase
MNIKTGLKSAAFSVVMLASFNSANANPVTDVNDDMLRALRAAATSPTSSGRNIAMVQLAMYDSANAASGLKYKTYAYSGPAVSNASADAAALQAGYAMIKQLYPTQYASLGLQTKLDNSLAALNLSSANLTASTTLGNSVALNQFTQRISDGVSTASLPAYVYTNGVGAFQSTTANPAAQPAAPGYGNVTPFVVNSSSQFEAPPPPTVGSATWITDFNEVLTVGQIGGASAFDQASSVFWADGAGTFTASGHWLSIASSAALSAGLDAMESARLGAMLATAMADASITAWETKYDFPLWRPVTAIRNCPDAACAALGVGQTGWTPYLKNTPNHPSYVSAHSSVSSAGATVLAAYFGSDAFSFCSTPDGAPAGFATPSARCYTSFSQAAAEAGQSRIFGGIHYQFDNVAGLALGRGVGNYVSQNAFGAVPEPTTWAMMIFGFGLVGGAMRRRHSVRVTYA